MVKILKSLGVVENVAGGDLIGTSTLEDDTKYLVKEWSRLNTFIQYHFNNHLRQDSNYRSHCCRYA